MGPGGHWQWRPVGRKAGSNSSAAQDLPDLMMFTTDLALLEDPVYKSLVVEYAGDLAALTTHFGQAWYKLLTRGMGPVSRCLGKGVPPAQVSGRVGLMVGAFAGGQRGAHTQYS
jgi:catalase (peroxidase I)